MHLTTLAAAALLFLPGAGAPRAAHPALPWLSNVELTAVATADDPEAHVAGDALGEAGADCGAAARTTLAVTIGEQRVIASYAGGVAVLGGAEHLVAAAPGYPCAGSADALEVLAAGHASGRPVIVLALTTGGHNASLTWLGMYRVGFGGRLEATFAGAVELREGARVRRGSVTALPGALLHREPSGQVILWRWDEVAGVYLPPAPHGDEP